MPSISSTSPAPPPTPPLACAIVYLYAFDIAHELRSAPLVRLLGRSVEQVAAAPDKRIPLQPFVQRPRMVRLDDRLRQGPRGPVTMSTTIKILPMGAVTITMSVRASVVALADLVAYHEARFDAMSLHDEARRLASEVASELREHLVRPIADLAHEEAYTVFCLDSSVVEAVGAKAWLDGERRAVAALLTQEGDAAALADDEVVESTARALSYYRNDLVVVDWDAALVIDHLAASAESLFILELANLQLTELEAYDRALDLSIEGAYRDLSRRRLGRRVIRELGEIRIDFARLNDELSNSIKIFGDWHLARVYAAISGRFHLGDWQRSIDDKLKTLDGIYQVLSHERSNRLMLLLESIVVVLFVIDLILIALELVHQH